MKDAKLQTVDHPFIRSSNFHREKDPRCQRCGEGWHTPHLADPPDERDFRWLESAALKVRRSRSRTAGPAEAGFIDLGVVFGAVLRANGWTPEKGAIPPDIVCLLFDALKLLRAAREDRGFCLDDFVDKVNYTGYAAQIARRRRRVITQEFSADHGGGVRRHKTRKDNH